MKFLRQYIEEAEENRVAIGHFNISDLVALRAVFDAAQEVSRSKGEHVPVIIGTSEGERDWIGVRQVVALVKSLREEHNYPIFSNADHTYSLDKVKEAVSAGYDAVIFDGARLSFEENVAKTKEAVVYVRSVNPEILVEGELGYIGTSSQVFTEIPDRAGVCLTTPEEAAEFIKETGVDLFAPAVGNLHGMLEGVSEPHLDTERIGAIREVATVPLVLHGGSGTRDEEFVSAIDAGISIVHINTELRVAWRRGVEEDLGSKVKEVAPYKLLRSAYDEVRRVTLKRLKLFNKLV